MKIVILILLLAALPVQAERRLEVYPLQGPDPAAIEELTREIVGEHGRVIPDPRGGRLLVLTTPDIHVILREILQKAAVPHKNVQIEVVFDETASEQDSGAALSGSLTVGPGGSSWQLRPQAHHQSSQQEGSTRQLLVAASGTEASLRVGTSIPYLEWTVDYSRFNPLITIGTRWQDAGAFLVFRPIIMPDGNTIHIEITPEIRGHAEGRARTVRFASLQTSLYARNGQSISIGEWAEAQTLFNRFLVGLQKQDQNRTLHVRMTPRILTP